MKELNDKMGKTLKKKGFDFQPDANQRATPVDVDITKGEEFEGAMELIHTLKEVCAAIPFAMLHANIIPNENRNVMVIHNTAMSVGFINPTYTVEGSRIRVELVNGVYKMYKKIVIVGECYDFNSPHNMKAKEEGTPPQLIPRMRLELTGSPAFLIQQVFNRAKRVK